MAKPPASCAVKVNVVSDIVPAEVPSKNTSVPAGTPVTVTVASSAGVLVLKLGLKTVFATMSSFASFI